MADLGEVVLSSGVYPPIKDADKITANSSFMDNPSADEYKKLSGWKITKDKGQRYNPLQKTELQTYRIKQFAFHSGNLSGPEMAKILSDNLRKIFNLIESNLLHLLPR